jgi:protein SCO1/2
MDSKLFRRSLQWTSIVLCALLVAVYAYQYFVLDKQLPVLAKAADFQLEASDNQQIKMSRLDGKVRLVYFFFANCPDVCPPTTKKLADVQQQLFADGYSEQAFHLLSVTVDPVNDDAKKLNEFAAKVGVDQRNWSFLYAADDEATKSVAKAYGVGVLRDSANRLLHNNQVALVDADGQIRAFYEDDKIVVDEIVADMKTLLQ